MILPSGVSAIDRLLNGGLSTGLLTHIFGEAAGGKTTIALQFLKAACRLGVHTVYINSEGSSPIERLEQIVGKEFNAINDMVTIIVPKTFKEQGTVIDDIELYARKGTRLVIIDTLTRLYRSVLEDKKTNYSAHRELNRQIGVLKGLAKHQNIGVFVLNQVRASMDSSNDIEPVAKNIMDYWSDYVLKLRLKQRVKERILERIVPEGDYSDCILYMTQKGLVTEKEEKVKNGQIQSET